MITKKLYKQGLKDSLKICDSIGFIWDIPCYFPSYISLVNKFYSAKSEVLLK